MTDAPKSRRVLEQDLSEPVPIPDEAIDSAVRVLRSGRLFRYGEFTGGASEVARLEREFADYMGCNYAVAMNSCGSAMFVALKCAGVMAGDNVLLNAFTLAPVPGAVAHAGAVPLFVECDDECRLSLDDLEAQAAAGPAKVFLMSHMRGHLADMHEVRNICQRHGVVLIEDCAHTLGARWAGLRSGSFGEVACFSLQAFKHINAGEGGILTTNNDDIAAKAILYSGSYMLYEQNGARPSLDVFERHKLNVPNLSLRMSELTAAVARPQLGLLAKRAKDWAERYALLARLLDDIIHVHVAQRQPQEDFVGSSIQFWLTDLEIERIPRILDGCRQRGVDIKWFGRAEPQGFTSTWEDWRFFDGRQTLPKTRKMLDGICDMRIPLSLALDDCAVIADIVREEIESAQGR